MTIAEQPPPAPPASETPPEPEPPATLRSLLSLDPSVPARRSLHDDAAVLAAVRRDPAAAAKLHRFPLGHARSAPMHPLSIAVCLGASAETIDALYRAHPDAIGSKNGRMGYTPLHWACRYKQSDPVGVLRLLCREYPDALSESGRGYGCQTPLRVACLYGAPASSIRVLVDAYRDGARIRDRDGRAALHLACECGGSASADVVRVLLEACPEALGWSDRKGRTPLHAAFEFGAAPEVIMALIQAMGDQSASLLSASDRAGNTPLHKACSARAPLDVLRSMLEVDPSLAARTNKAGEVPLCLLWEAMTEREMHAAIRGVPLPSNDNDNSDVGNEGATVAFRLEAAALRSRIRLLLRASHYGTVEAHLPCTEQGVERKFRMLHAACGVRCPRLLLDLVLERHRDEAAERDEEGNTALGLAVRSMGRLRRDVVVEVVASREGRRRMSERQQQRHQRQQRRGTATSSSASSALTATAAKSKILIPDESLSRMLYCKSVASSLLTLCPQSAYSRDPHGRYPLHVALHGGMTWHDGAVAELVTAGPEVVTVRDIKTRLYPHEMAAAYVRDANTIFELMEIYPHVLKNRIDVERERTEKERELSEDGKAWEKDEVGADEDERGEDEEAFSSLDWNHCNIS